MATTPLLQIGIQLGLDVLLVKPRRGIGDLPIAQATLEEIHHDELEITDQPIEQGASITDHAFKRPAECIIRCGYSNSPGSSTLLGSIAGAVTGTLGGISSLLTGNSESQVKEIYQKFLQLQADRQPFDVYTGKRVYKDMLIKGLSTTTNKETENSLVLTVHLRQIIIVAAAISQSVSADAEDQSDPEDTDPTDDEGTQQLQEADSYNEDAGEASLDDTGDPDDPDVSMDLLEET